MDRIYFFIVPLSMFFSTLIFSSPLKDKSCVEQGINVWLDAHYFEHISTYSYFSNRAPKEALDTHIQALSKRSGIHLFLVFSEIDTLPFESNFFDLIVCEEGIVSNDPESCMEEITRVLNRNGTLRVITHSSSNIPSFLNETRVMNSCSTILLIKRLNRRDVQSIIKTALSSLH